MGRRRKVTVPGSSANLGPGYDVLAAAVSPQLELEVEEGDGFSVDAGHLDLPADESNLCVRAFAELYSVEGLSFQIRSEIPVAAGMGSSGAALVAGLVAADHMYELALSREELLQKAAELEGHPDNVAASLFGGFVICSAAAGVVHADRIEPPAGLEAVAVIPAEGLSTGEARSALPAEIPLGDVIHNVSTSALLILGLARGDPDLVSRGLADKLHQPRRAHLYPRSTELVERARELGALGATVSGAGPTILFWVLWEQTGSLVENLRQAVADWAEVRRVQFVTQGATVSALSV